jgi:four helix bundle protein
MEQLDHERLDAYRLAVRFAGSAARLTRKFPRGYSYLADQLQRAAASVCLNLAEGAGEWQIREKARFYRIARRSAAECAAVLDVCAALAIEELPITDLCQAKDLLRRVVATSAILLRVLAARR